MAEPGPVTLDARLLGSAGRVHVRADPNCTEAQITISTYATRGPAYDAVRNAQLTQDSGRILAEVDVQAASGRTVRNVRGTYQRGIQNNVGGTDFGGRVFEGDFVVGNDMGVSSHTVRDIQNNYVGNTFGGDRVDRGMRSSGGARRVIIGDLHIGPDGQETVYANGRSYSMDELETMAANGDPNSPLQYISNDPAAGGNMFVTGDGNSRFAYNYYGAGDDGGIVHRGSTPEIEIHAVVPEGSSVDCRTTSAALVTEGKVDTVRVHTASGSVDVTSAGTVEANTWSGQVTVDGADTVKATTDSGQVYIKNAERATGTTDSGQVYIKNAERATGTTISGDITIVASKDAKGASESGRVEIRNSETANGKSSSGDVSIVSSKHATGISTDGRVDIDDVQGWSEARSSTGNVRVSASTGGEVRASSTTGSVSVNALPAAVDEGLKVKAEGPPGRVRIPAGANTQQTAASSSGERDFKASERSGPGRESGSGRD
ncbi:hypothetical protein [Kribbella solani]|uniref:Putative low-complexity protein n=1 Tax=Kribbella solani TaxID=236067 RepID=A0A841DTM1_9ACTN|nr:hypothetical protein [Kribbella solani]MBB5981922.1 putative low-complexity protein [Kribbella solani]